MAHLDGAVDRRAERHKEDLVSLRIPRPSEDLDDEESGGFVGGEDDGARRDGKVDPFDGGR